MVRLLLHTGDDKVFNNDVLLFSNKLLAYLLTSHLFAPLFLPYIFSTQQSQQVQVQQSQQQQQQHSNNNAAVDANSSHQASHTVKAVFVSCFPRLLLYECQEGTRTCLSYAYAIMWALCSYNNHNNTIQDMLSSRNQESKLLNLVRIWYCLLVS